MKQLITKLLSKEFSKSQFLLICITFYSFLWVWSYLPFFKDFFAPLIAPDTFEYFEYTYYWLTGQGEEIINCEIDMPLGVPIYHYIIWKLGGGVFVAVLLQTILLYAAAAQLQYKLFKYYKNWAFIAILTIPLFLLKEEFFLWSVGPVSECLFTVSIIFLISQLITFLEEKSNAFLLGFGFALPLLIRSNALALIPIPVGFLIIGFLVKDDSLKKIIKTWGISTIAFLIFSHAITGYLNYGNLSRALFLLDKKYSKEKVRTTPKNQIFFNQINPTYIGTSPFYNNQLAILMDLNYVKRRYLDEDYINLGVRVPGKEMKKMFFGHNKEDVNPEPFLKQIEKLDVSQPQGFIISSHLQFFDKIKSHNIESPFYYLSFLLFVGFFIYNLWVIIIKKTLRKIPFILTVIGTVHYLNLFLVLYEHNNFVYRYTLVTEIAIFAIVPIYFRHFSNLIQKGKGIKA